MLSKIHSFLKRRKVPTEKIGECLKKRKCLEGHRLKKVESILREGKRFIVYCCIECSLRERRNILYTPTTLTKDEKKSIASKVQWMIASRRVGFDLMGYEPTMYNTYSVFQQEDDFEELGE